MGSPAPLADQPGARCQSRCRPASCRGGHPGIAGGRDALQPAPHCWREPAERPGLDLISSGIFEQAAAQPPGRRPAIGLRPALDQVVAREIRDRSKLIRLERASYPPSIIWTAQGWLYLAVMLDLYSRRVIGWAVGARMTSDLPLRALNRAIGLRQPGAGVIHHSDRGSQYCSDAYQTRLGELGFLASMSGKGNCYDNAVVETFFKTIKSELIWRTVFMSRSQAETAIARYIDGFYNPVRRHSDAGLHKPRQIRGRSNANGVGRLHFSWMGPLSICPRKWV